MWDNSSNKQDETLGLGQDNSQKGADELDEVTKERYKQQMAWAKAEVAKTREEAQQARQLAIDIAVSAAKVDGNTLLDLYEKDPKLAEEVAKDWFWLTIEQVREEMWVTKKWVTKDVDLDLEEKFEKWYKERTAKETHESSLKKVESEFDKLPNDEMKQKAREKFTKLSEGRTLTPELAKEFAEMATLYVWREAMKSDAYSEFVKEFSSVSLGWSKASDSNGNSDDGSYILNWKFYSWTSK